VGLDKEEDERRELLIGFDIYYHQQQIGGPNMAEEYSVKETKELLVGLNHLSLMLVKHLKDGFQLGKDSVAIVSELMTNKELKTALSEAANGVSKVPAEIKDMSLAEGMELVMVQVDFVPKLLEAMKADAASE